MELEQPGSPQDSAQADNAGGENQNDTGSEDQLGLDQSNSDSQEQADEEEEEIEIGERKFALPKSAAEKLKAERLMQADYTQKTQGVAEERKQVAAEREQVREQQKQAQEYLNEVADIRAVEKQIKQIDEMDLSQYMDSDPVGVMKVQEQRRALEVQRQQLVGAVTQKQQQNALVQQQETAKQIQDAEAYIAREIPAWTEQRTAEITNYAKAIGIDPAAMWQQVFKTPAFAKVLHKAEMFDRLEKQKVATKPKPQVQEKPVTRLTTAKAGAQRDPDKMSMEDFVKWRNEQRRKR